MADVYRPAGWPEAVASPGIEDWQASAVAWLLDLVPDLREHTTVRRHPVILAAIARHTVTGSLDGARQGYRIARTELGEAVPPHAVDAALRPAWYRYDLPMLTAAWVQAIAAVVTAAAVVYAVVVWAWSRRPRGVVGWIKARYFPPRVSLEAGVRTARKFARSGHPPFTPTEGAVSPDQPLDYLLAKVTETVWAAASDSGPNLIPVRNYLAALAGKAGTGAARDFALGVLTERVRQEEDGWPDHPGDAAGKRAPHGGGNSHLCLLERKHQVEDAVYGIGA